MRAPKKTVAGVTTGVVLLIGTAGAGIALAAGDGTAGTAGHGTSGTAGDGTSEAAGHGTSGTAGQGEGKGTAGRIAKLHHKADLRFDAADHRLAQAKSRVDGSKVLTAADKTLLDGEIAALTTRLHDARTTLDATTTPAAFRTAAKADRGYIAQGRLLARQGRQLGMVDAVAALQAKAGPKLAAAQAKVDQLPEGADKTKAQAALADIVAKVADAADKAATVGTSDRALSITDPDAARSTLATNATGLKTLRVDRTAVKADRTLLRQLIQGSHT